MSEQVPAPPAPKNPFARLAGVIVSPGETFAEISRSPGWIPPFLIYLVLFSVSMAVFSTRADWIAIDTARIEGNPIVKLAPESTREDAVRRQTELIRKMTPGQAIVSKTIENCSGIMFYFSGVPVIFSTLFVMVGALPKIKLGRVWGQFLLCLLVYFGYLGVAIVANIGFKDSVSSALLLTGFAFIAMVAVWAWILNKTATGDEEFLRMLSISSYACVVLIVGSLALLGTALLAREAIQTPPESVVKSNVAAFITTSPGVLQKLLESMDVLTVGLFVLLTIGFRIATKLSMGVTAAMTFLPWAVVVLIKLSLAAL